MQKKKLNDLTYYGLVKNIKNIYYSISNDYTVKNLIHGCKKTTLKYFNILKLQFNSSQTVQTELLRKPNENILNILKQRQIILPY